MSLANDPNSIVDDNLTKAEFFLDKAQQHSDIPLEWCLEIAAGAIWAAATVSDKGKKSAPRKSWLKKNGRIVFNIRNAIEHHSFNFGVGQSSIGTATPPNATVDEDGTIWTPFGSREGEGVAVETHVWGIGKDSVPVDEVIDDLRRICESLRRMLWEESGTRYIKFHVATAPAANKPAGAQEPSRDG